MPTPPAGKIPALRVVPTLAVVAALWAGQIVLIPIVLSLLISYALEPLAEQVARWIAWFYGYGT
jgi:predicted PurR-regulated permease PerM